MDYQNDYPASSAINLPPIRAMDFEPQTSTSRSSHSYYSLPPPPGPASRQLPPLPYQYPMHGIPQAPEYITSARTPYGDHDSSYGSTGGRLPIPPGLEASIQVVPSRQLSKTKEVKRRTKTGCMTCRRRRIKVSGHFFRSWLRCGLIFV